MDRLQTQVVLMDGTAFLVRSWCEADSWKAAWLRPKGGWIDLGESKSRRGLAVHSASVAARQVLAVAPSDLRTRRLNTRWASAWSLLLAAQATVERTAPNSPEYPQLQDALRSRQDELTACDAAYDAPAAE